MTGKVVSCRHVGGRLRMAASLRTITSLPSQWPVLGSNRLDGLQMRTRAAARRLAQEDRRYFERAAVQSQWPARSERRPSSRRPTEVCASSFQPGFATRSMGTRNARSRPSEFERGGGALDASAACETVVRHKVQFR